MLNGQRFSFIERYDCFGVPEASPCLPLTLTYQERSLEVLGLLDTGASVNVLLYEIGVQLGAVWEEQRLILRLGGNLATVEARGLIVSAKVGQFPSVDLAFAWTKTNNVPLLLGQMNFFREFDVCFYGAQLVFEIRPKQTSQN